MKENPCPKETRWDQRDIEPDPLSDPVKEELAVLESESLSELEQNVPLITGTRRAPEDNQDDSYNLASSSLKATEKYRGDLFNLAVVLVVFVTFISTIVVICSIGIGPPNPTIIAAYFSSVTVQIVGVLIVVAKSIFPSDHLQQVTRIVQAVDKTAPHQTNKSTPS